MKKMMIMASTIAISSGAAFAGGIDRSLQDIGILFEEGNYVELSFGYVSPSVSGVVGGTVSSGNMTDPYTQFSGAIKFQINDQYSVALIADQPFGASVSYPVGTGYPLAGTTAELSTQALTLMGRYKINENFSVHAGLRQQTISGDVFITPGYTLDVGSDSGFGYVLGAAYEIPDIALRAAITYNSGIDQRLKGTELGGPTQFDIRTPQSVNIDFQTGIAEDTLLFGAIRWVNWSNFDISPPLYTGANGPLVYYEKDIFNYQIGIGRRFSENFAGSFALGYEHDQNLLASNLGPTDGYYSVQLGGEYKINNMILSGGIRYLMIGDTVTRAVGGEFKNNSAFGVGFKVGYEF